MQQGMMMIVVTADKPMRAYCRPGMVLSISFKCIITVLPYNPETVIMLLVSPFYRWGH